MSGAHPPARLVTHINHEVGTVGGNFQQYAAAMAHQLVAHATTHRHRPC
jgi:hypothetical protein